MADPNLDLLEDAAAKLTPLLSEVVFIGGAMLGLLVTDEGAAPIRGTIDVDVIAEITTYADYTAFSGRLQALGFIEDPRESAPVCRWVKISRWMSCRWISPSSASATFGTGEHSRPRIGSLCRAGRRSGSSPLLSFWPPRWRLFEGEAAETSLQVTI